MKVLVTGGAGFLASHVADTLTEAGHEVVVYDVSPSTYLKPNQQQTVGSILDREALCQAAQGCDILYHFAAIADIGEASSDPVRTIEVNIMGTVNALEAARLAGVRRFVLASSIYVYSDQGSFYRTSKQACERLVEDYKDTFGLPYTVLRFGSLYGPRAGKTNAIYRMVDQALHEGKISYAGSGSEVREYI
ncbi:MAG: NAD(P)-dependent oxidoreductase, partial [Magnetospirillum sp.]|nr:NAD(P)-dependent oxidoreductase [Magnetospirillum sp.]